MENPIWPTSGSLGKASPAVVHEGLQLLMAESNQIWTAPDHNSERISRRDILVHGNAMDRLAVEDLTLVEEFAGSGLEDFQERPFSYQ
jgi:hypothetical protein